MLVGFALGVIATVVFCCLAVERRA